MTCPLSIFSHLPTLCTEVREETSKTISAASKFWSRGRKIDASDSRSSSLRSVRGDPPSHQPSARDGHMHSITTTHYDHTARLPGPNTPNLPTKLIPTKIC